MKIAARLTLIFMSCYVLGQLLGIAIAAVVAPVKLAAHYGYTLIPTSEFRAAPAALATGPSTCTAQPAARPGEPPVSAQRSRSRTERDRDTE